MMQLAVAQVQRRLRVLHFLQLSREVFVEDLLAAIHKEDMDKIQHAVFCMDIVDRMTHCITYSRSLSAHANTLIKADKFLCLSLPEHLNDESNLCNKL